MNTELAEWQEIIQYLQGSCNTLPQALDVFDREDLENDPDFLNYLDRHIFLCETCNWWCPVEEMTDDMECEDCGEEQ
tara:strand:+ start:2296 stop:2526 length:231 start_codon:yes stop_codon:yes gene_type:complete